MPKASSVIPVIDIFAGPGGLGEGFHQYWCRGKRPFDVRLSIEKDPIACDTLRLRKFFHQFESPPSEYDAAIRRDFDFEQLYRTYPRQATTASERTWQAELGKTPPRAVTTRVRAALAGTGHWVLLGGPPCQAYSLVGRSRMRSTHQNFEADERHFLYREYLRIVADHRPSAFVFENVKGLLSSTQGGTNVFPRILSDLASPTQALQLRGRRPLQYRLYALSRQAQLDLISPHHDAYDVADFLVLSEQHGIPQSRHRIIVVGIRSDIEAKPPALELQSTVDAGYVLDDLPAIRSRLSQEEDSLDAWRQAVAAICELDWFRRRKGSEFAPVAVEIERALRFHQRHSLESGGTYLDYSGRPSSHADWYRNGATGLSLHESRQHRRDDLHRYLYAACFLRAFGRSPKIRDFPVELHPDHKNVDLAVKGKMFGDRFRVQAADQPSTTVTSHIAKDGHYFIHYSAEQCRSLTVREAARLQTFPDSYFFCGGRTEQYHQVGNAVPPLLARQIADSVFGALTQPGRRK